MATSGERREHAENRCFTNEETPLLADQSVTASDAAGAEESLIALSPWRKPKYFLLIETGELPSSPISLCPLPSPQVFWSNIDL
jgi:hypothetical protein